MSNKVMLETANNIRHMYFVDFCRPGFIADYFSLSYNETYNIIHRKGKYKDLPDLITEDQYQDYQMNKSLYGNKMWGTRRISIPGL